MRMSWTVIGANAAGDAGTRDALECANGLWVCGRSDGDEANRIGSHITVAVAVKTKDLAKV
jgi:hypothetical protein